MGFRSHKVSFPEIGKGATNPKLESMIVVKEHAVVKGLKENEGFTHGYADHIAIEVGRLGEVIVSDEKNNPVLVVGKIGKGKIVLNGMVTGYASKVKGQYGGEDKIPEGGELKVLINSVKWLAEK